MAATFPNSVKTWTALVDHVSRAQASDVNTVYEEVTAVQTYVKTGTYSTEAESQASIVSLPSTAQGLMSEFEVEGRTINGYDANTKLLLYFDGADASTTFVDQTGKTVVASGNVQLDTAQKRYNTASGLFDGTGDYLTITDANNDLDLGTGDFTIECWVRFASVVGVQMLVDFRQVGAGDIAPNLFIEDGYLKYGVAGVRIISTNVVVANIFYHIAVVRNSGVSKMFIDGAQTGSNYTDTNNFIDVTSIKIGVLASTGVNYYLNGHMDELRISNSARYTTTFTPESLRLLSVDKCRIKSTGKNLFDKSKVTFGRWYNNSSTVSVVTGYTSEFIKVTKSTNIYITNTVGNSTYYATALFDTDRNIIGNANISGTGMVNGIINTGNAEYIVVNGYINSIDSMQIELGSIATSYEPYQELSATCPVPLRSVSETIRDKWDVLSGEITKNVSDWLELTGNTYSWAFEGDYSGFKGVYASNVFDIANKTASQVFGIKYNNKQLNQVGTGLYSVADSMGTGGGSTVCYISVADTDTGWFEGWTAGSGFTGMTWGGLIKAYMNGWKMTTVEGNVASCVWTGIASGTTKSGASGYSDTTTTLDTGYTPYRMLYQLATPEISYTNPANLLSSASGQVVQEALLEGVYTSPYVNGNMIYIHPTNKTAQIAENTNAIAKSDKQLTGWAIVCAGGTGRYTSLADAVDAHEPYIYIKNGTYKEGTIVITEDYTNILGESHNAIVELPVSEDGIKIYANHCKISNFTIDATTNAAEACLVIGDGLTAGNGDETIGCFNKITDMKMMGTTGTTFTLYVAGASYSTGSDTLTHFESNSLQEGNVISGCEFHSTWTGDALSFSLQKNAVFSNNISYGGRIAFYMCRDSECNNNVVDTSSNQGMFIGCPVYNCSISGNRISNAASSGIKIENQLEHAPLLTGQAMLNCVVSNNIIYHCALTGLEISGSSSHEHKNNIFEGNTISYAGFHGIYMQYAKNNIIRGNHIYNCKHDPAQTRGSGIYMVATVQYNTFDGNYIHNDDVAVMAHSAIANREDTTCTYNTIVNNFINCYNSERTVWVQSTGYKISNNFITGGYYAGILLEDGATNALVTDNKLVANTRESNNVYSEINVKASSNGAMIMNNMITGGTNQAKYGIECATPVSDYTILDNVISNVANAQKVITAGTNHSATKLTIAGGIVTVTRSYHTVDTESSASTDDLDTISGGYSGGQIITLCAENTARTVVAKDGTGNLKLAGDFTMDDSDDVLTLVYDNTNKLWREVCRSAN